MRCVSPPAACHLTVWLSDPGGRDLCGLAVSFSSLDNQQLLVSRVGQEVALSPGRWRLRVEMEPPLDLVVDLGPGEQKIEDLGRLASVMVSWDADIPTRGFPFYLRREGGEVTGRVGLPLEVAPGTYTLMMDPNIPLACPPSRLVELRGGRLTEIELGTSAGAHLSFQSLRRALGDELRGALNSLRLRMSRPVRTSRAVPPLPRGLMLRDAFGHGVRRQLTLRSGATTLRYWTFGDELPSPGPWQAELDGLPGYCPVFEWSPGVELPPLGALEVHLKDPEARSLRGALVICTGQAGGASFTGRLGYPLELGPGTYEVEVPAVWGARRQVQIPSGQVVEIDLGVAGWLDGEGLEASATVRAEGDTRVLGTLVPGDEQLAIPGKYTLVQAGGSLSREAKRRKKYRPSVVFRTAAEPLPLDADGSDLSELSR